MDVTILFICYLFLWRFPKHTYLPYYMCRIGNWKRKIINPTWRTEAPLWRNWSPLSAESIPPVAKIGNPGKARAMAVTALKAIGLMAVPAEDKEAWWSDFLKWVHIAIFLLLSKVSILLDKFPISLSVSKCFKFSVNVDLRMWCYYQIQTNYKVDMTSLELLYKIHTNYGLVHSNVQVRLLGVVKHLFNKKSGIGKLWKREQSHTTLWIVIHFCTS